MDNNTLDPEEKMRRKNIALFVIFIVTAALTVAVIAALIASVREGKDTAGEDHAGTVAPSSSGGGETPEPAKDLLDPESPLMISEIMVDNTKFPIDGKTPDYIELCNISESEVGLSSFFLSDKPGQRGSALPDRTLKAGEYTLLVCGKDLDFNLSKEGERVTLSSGDKVLHSVSFGQIGKNLVVTPDGISDLPSPGYSNDRTGYEKYICSRTGLIISEVLASNSSAYASDGGYYDTVELLNASDSSLELSDYYLTDSMGEPERFRLPQGTLAPGEYKLIVFDGKESSPSFSLSSDGESIKLTRKDGYIQDVLTCPYLPTDISYGRSGSSLLYFDKPTLGKANGSGYAKMTAAPFASAASGFYSAPFEITLSGNGNIYYTLDGSRPTEKSKKYTGESIKIENNTTVRALSAAEGELKSVDAAFNYFINVPDLTLPIIKVSVTENDMYGPDGIYTNYSKRNEIEARVAMYIGGKEQFSVNCGLKVHGAYSRRYEKKSYQLKFRAKYGCARLKYDVFGDGEVTEFNSLVLRSGSQDQFRSMMRDEFATGVMGDHSDELLVQKYRPVNLYINGEYIGVYYIREKINDDFVASHYGVSPGSVTIVGKMTEIETGSSGAEWRALWKYIQNSDLTVKENYEYICERISIDSAIDFYIAMTWSDNRDADNVRIFKSTENDGKWRFIFFDNDLGFGRYKQDSSKSTAAFLFGKYSADTPLFNALIYKLFRNNEFRDRFLKRLNELTKTAFSNETVQKRIDEIEEAIDGDMKYQPPRESVPSYERWKNGMVPELENYVKDRAVVLIDEFSELLKLTKSERESYFK